MYLVKVAIPSNKTEISATAPVELGCVNCKSLALKKRYFLFCFLALSCESFSRFLSSNLAGCCAFIFNLVRSLNSFGSGIVITITCAGLKGLPAYTSSKLCTSVMSFDSYTSSFKLADLKAGSSATLIKRKLKKPPSTSSSLPSLFVTLPCDNNSSL